MLTVRVDRRKVDLGITQPADQALGYCRLADSAGTLRAGNEASFACFLFSCSFCLFTHIVTLLGFHGSRGIAFVEKGSPFDPSSCSLAVARVGFCKSRVDSMLLNPSGT